eukprot:TRINITY_DN8437_c0_g1_i2.p1 TRINITY_DN8437_c0_g1~~TRINITY_DN8437_c0_g1_i2.p1  ORF type:complete len:201 (-),score=59.63 TRINITY_DN8437_c0_g1_i2:43-645(-)
MCIRDRPYTEIANLMRAMGYYPTLLEIENMQNEIKYSGFFESGGQFTNEIDLSEFVRLYVNHRPVYGVGKEQIEEALNEISKPIHRKSREDYLSILRNEGKDDGMKALFLPTQEISKEEFLEMLQNYGEKMTYEEIKSCINTLMGEGAIDDPNFIPETITADFLIKNLLQFEEVNEEANEQGMYTNEEQNELQEQEDEDN